MANTDSYNISEKVSNKIYIPYATYTGEEGAATADDAAAETTAETTAATEKAAE